MRISKVVFSWIVSSAVAEALLIPGAIGSSASKLREMQGQSSEAVLSCSNTRYTSRRHSPLAAIRAEGSIDSEVPHRRALKTPVETFATLIECLDAMDNSLSDDGHDDHRSCPEFTVVLFFAHYCKLCHHANIPYKKMAYQADPNEMRFTRLETSVMSSSQFRSLGISRVPFVQIYRHGVCVASFNTKWQLESKLKETLMACQARTISEWGAFMRQYESEIRGNKMARRLLRQEALIPASVNPRTTGGIQTLASATQLLDAIDQSEERPTMVMFHSHFEPACVRAQHQYRRISGSPVGDDMTLTRLESSVLSESFLKSLGVERYPHIQIYKSRKCVASFSVPQTYVFRSLVTNSLEEVKQRQPEEWDTFYRKFENEIQEKQAALEFIRSEQLSP